jgi:hypothetical protein
MTQAERTSLAADSAEKDTSRLEAFNDGGSLLAPLALPLHLWRSLGCLGDHSAEAGQRVVNSIAASVREGLPVECLPDLHFQ